MALNDSVGMQFYGNEFDNQSVYSDKYHQKVSSLSLIGGEQEMLPSDAYKRTYSSDSSLHEVPLTIEQKQVLSTWEQAGLQLDLFAGKMNLLMEDNQVFKYELERSDSDVEALKKFI